MNTNVVVTRCFLSPFESLPERLTQLRWSCVGCNDTVTNTYGGFCKCVRGRERELVFSILTLSWKKWKVEEWHGCVCVFMFNMAINIFFSLCGAFHIYGNNVSYLAMWDITLELYACNHFKFNATALLLNFTMFIDIAWNVQIKLYIDMWLLKVFLYLTMLYPEVIEHQEHLRIRNPVQKHHQLWPHC